MQAPKVRNAVFGHLQGIRPAGPRLYSESCSTPAYDFDFLAVIARSPAELVTIRAARHRRFRTKPDTMSRRRDVVERAEQVARMLGWEWTDDEQALLAGFVGDLSGVENSVDQPGRGAVATPACGAFARSSAGVLAFADTGGDVTSAATSAAARPALSLVSSR